MELGLPLFERKGKNIKLNRYGHLFLRYVERAMHEITAGRQVLLDLQNPDRGSIPLAFLHSLGTHTVPELLKTFRAAHPDVQFKLYQNATSLLLDQLESGEIDLCLSSPTVTREGIEWTSLFTEELFLAVPSAHRLARLGPVSLEAIAGEPLITFKKDYGLRILTDQLLAAANVEPVITFEGEEIMTVAGLVEANLGVAIIPQVSGLDKTLISFLPISNPVCRRSIGIAWIKDRYLPPVSRNFKEFVIRFFLNPNDI
jgi:DNA-binding transcriptional LysR family regulator